MKFKSKLSWTINEYGKDLISVNLKINKDILYEGLFKISAFYGCPKLKSLTLESFRGREDGPPLFKEKDQNLIIESWQLKDLYNRCKELKDLKLTNVSFVEIYTENQIKIMFPGCNVEIKQCKFDEFDQNGYSSDDYHFRGYDSDSYESNSDDWYDHGRYFDNSWDVSFDDGEQDSIAESGDDETNDILDNFDGGEIDLMFSQNYGEDNNEDDQFMDNAGDFLDALVTSDQD